MTTKARTAEWNHSTRWQDPRRGSTWAGDRTKEYSEDDREAMGLAREWLARTWVPGRDAEPVWSAELIDRDGTVWRKVQEGKTGSTGAWSPEGEPDVHLKWSSPAMAVAGPFMGPRRLTAEEVSEQKRAASNIRWAREKERRNIR